MAVETYDDSGSVITSGAAQLLDDTSFLSPTAWLEPFGYVTPSEASAGNATIGFAESGAIVGGINNPNSIVGCVAWLDGADSSTITIATGVSEWNDKSGHANNVAQATGSKQPSITTVNGLSTLSFNDSNGQFLGNASASALPQGAAAFSIFSVASTPTTSTYAYLLAFGGVSVPDANVTFLNSGYGYAWADGSGGSYVATNDAIDTATHVISQTYPGSVPLPTNYGMWKDGTTQSIPYFAPFTPAVSGTGLYVGSDFGASSPYWNGTISEIIVYAGDLSTGDRQTIEGYLAWKWGIEANLPSTHPYYSAPPTGWLGGSGAISGSATIAFSESGALHGTASLAGNSTVQFAESGAITGAGRLAGAAAVAFSEGGLIAGSGKLTAAGTVVFSESGALHGSGVLGGAATASFAESGALHGSGALAAAGTIVFTASGGFAVPGLTGAGTIVFAASGAIHGTAALVGSSSISLAPAGYLVGAGALHAGGSIQFAESGMLGATVRISGTTAVVFGESGTLGGAAPLEGSAAVLFAESGALLGFGSLSGSAEAIFDAAGTVAAGGLLAGGTSIIFTEAGTLFVIPMNPVSLLLPISTQVGLALPVSASVALAVEISSDLTLTLGMPADESLALTLPISSIVYLGLGSP